MARIRRGWRHRGIARIHTRFVWQYGAVLRKRVRGAVVEAIVEITHQTLDVVVGRRGIKLRGTARGEGKGHAANRRLTVGGGSDREHAQILAEPENVLLIRIDVGEIGIRSGDQLEN